MCLALWWNFLGFIFPRTLENFYIVLYLICQELCPDAHGVDLLQQELARIRYAHLRKSRHVFAGAAGEYLLLRVAHRDHAASAASEDSVVVAAFHEALLEEVQHAVAPLTLDLHLAQPQAAVARAALGRLPRQEHHRAVRRARVHLVKGHVLQALIVGGAHEDGGRDLLAGAAVIEHVVAQPRLPRILQQVADAVDGRLLVERRGVAEGAVLHARGAQDALHELADGHAAGDRVGVDDDVGDEALGREGHVLRAVAHAHGALLPVPRVARPARSPDAAPSSAPPHVYDPRSLRDGAAIDEAVVPLDIRRRDDRGRRHESFIFIFVHEPSVEG